MQVIRLRRLMTARTTRAPFRSWMFSAGVLLAVSTAALAADAAALRRVIPLDGTWQVEQGKMASAPAEFSHTLVVPGLVDMARPAFAEVGVHSRLREAFWYRRTFRIDGPLPALAVLKVHKAMFGFRVILNGTPLGDHVGSFTPGMFDARAALRPGENEILIRVGAFRTSVPQVRSLRLGLRKVLVHPRNLRLRRTGPLRLAPHRARAGRSRYRQEIRCRSCLAPPCRRSRGDEVALHRARRRRPVESREKETATFPPPARARSVTRKLRSRFATVAFGRRRIRFSMSWRSAAMPMSSRLASACEPSVSITTPAGRC